METKQLPKRKEEVTKEAYKRYSQWFALDGETDVNGEEREAFVNGTEWADITMYERVRIYLTDYFNGCTMANFNPTNLIKDLSDFMLEGVSKE